MEFVLADLGERLFLHSVGDPAVVQWRLPKHPVVSGDFPGDKQSIQPSKEAFIFTDLRTSSANVPILGALTDTQGRTHLKVKSAFAFIRFLYAFL